MKKALSAFLAAIMAASAVAASTGCLTVTAGAVTWNEYVADTTRAHMTISKKIYGGYAELVFNLPKRDIEEAKAAIQQNHDNRLFLAWYDLGRSYMLNFTMKYDPEAGEIVTETKGYDSWGHDAKLTYEGKEYEYISHSIDYACDIETDSEGNLAVTYRLLTDSGLGESLAKNDDDYSDTYYRFTYYITGGAIDQAETNEYVRYEEGLSDEYNEPATSYRLYEEELIRNSTTNLSEVTISEVSDKTYTGKAIKPSVTLMDAGKKLVKGKDYKVTYYNNVNIGTATITVGGIGDYSGGRSIQFKILPKKVKLSGKITQTKVSLNWKKVKGADGYEIHCAYKGEGYGMVADINSTKYVKRNISSANKYCYKVRAYKIINGYKVYGAWSKVIKA